MQARNTQVCEASLLLLVLLSLAIIPMQPLVGFNSQPSEEGLMTQKYNPIDKTTEVNDPILVSSHYFSDSIGPPDPASGTLHPVQVEQRGIIGTGNISARTETKANTNTSLEIDTLHDWVASEANATITNLKRLYAVNGTFDEGIAGVNVKPNGTVSFYPLGWTSDSQTSIPDTIQKSAFVQELNPFIMLENEGNLLGTGSNTRFQHASGTRITWFQMIDNRPHVEDFILTLDFMYINGPLDSALGDAISLEVWIDGTRYWNQSLPQLASRDVWQSSGAVNIYIPGALDAFEFDVRLAINDDLSLYPAVYGFIDSNYLTVHVDNVVFTGNTSPTPDQVDLSFIAGGIGFPVTDSSGVGVAKITNPSYWNTSTLPIFFESNVSISFDYDVRLLNHRFTKSSVTTHIGELGVAYTIESGMSGTLEIYTYLGTYGIYDDQVLKISHPRDWENFTVHDPFLSDVSSSCTSETEVLIIPESLLDRLGWWKVTCEAPNYAASAIVERYDSVATDWVNESIFHSNDNSRISVSLGTATDIPILSDPVNFTWALSNCTVWHESSMIGGLGGNTSSLSVTFGPTNTTAGVWGVMYHWSNGTELAFDCETFVLHHTAILESVYSDTIEILVGQPVSIFLRFRDAENGLYIMNDGASVVANWTEGDVTFVPDIVKNWWQADFDTSPLGPGDYTTSIISAAPYFETAPLVITIKSQALASLNPPSGPLTPLIYGREHSYDFFYSMTHNGTGIDGAFVNTTEAGSQWASVEDVGDGHYELKIIPMAVGTYNLRTTFSKAGYETESHVLSFLVDPVPIEVESISSLVGLEQTPLEVEVHIVESDTGNPVTEANVTLGVYRPGAELYFFSEMEETSTGVYTVTLPMPSSNTGTYSVKISIEKANYEMIQSFTAALVPIYDINIQLMQTLLSYSWQIGIGAFIVVGAVAGYRVRTRRNRKKHALAMGLKNRFNDANNILGFLVLHKLTGVPIYSKVFKGGFEEGILSAFITAIMHFRTEFEMKKISDDYPVIPISEVIRTIPTENLICAFITVTPPSVDQEAKMRNYARAIGMLLDQTLAEQSVKAIDSKTAKTFEWLFDDLMDGQLVRRYQVGEKTFPKPLRFIENTIPLEEVDGSFSLVRLVRLLASSELSEDDVYIRVFRAIDDEYILPVYFTNNNVQIDSD